MNTQNQTPNNNSRQGSPSFLLLPIGGKGGCGKTTFLVYLLWLLLREVEKLRIYDFESGVDTGLTRYFPQARKMNLFSKTDLDHLINDFIVSPQSIAFVDLPANSGHHFERWVKDVPWSILAENNVEIVIVLAVSDDPDSMLLALPWIEVLQNRVRYIVVENEHFGEHFSPWRSSAEGIAFAAKSKPLIIQFPEIPANIQTLISNSAVTLFDALNERGVHELQKDWMERGRIRRVRAEIAARLKPALQLLHCLGTYDETLTP